MEMNVAYISKQTDIPTFTSTYCRKPGRTLDKTDRSQNDIQADIHKKALKVITKQANSRTDGQ
jgi:hypothetical protein